MADKQITHDDVTRRFYALFLESSVAADGQVKGFARWYDQASRRLRRDAGALIEVAWRKVQGGTDADEAIILAVQGMRLSAQRLDPPEVRSSPEYAAFRFGIIRAIDAQNLRPFEVAAMLEARTRDFPEIEGWEIDNLRNAHDDWTRAHAGTMARHRASA